MYQFLETYWYIPVAAIVIIASIMSYLNWKWNGQLDRTMFRTITSNTLCGMLVASIFTLITGVLLWCNKNGIKEEFYKNKETCKLVSLRTISANEANASMSGFSILGTGVISGSYDTKANYTFSFYMEDKDGYITRNVVPYDSVKFRIGDPEVIVQEKYYRNNGGEEKLVINLYKHTQYIITLPADSVDRYIRVSN